MRIPEHIQSRVYEYYYELTELFFIKNSEMYNYLSTSMTDTVKIQQIKESIFNLSILNKSNIRQIEGFARNLKITFYLSGDIILKEGSENFTFFYIHKGLVEVIQQNKDFIYFDWQEVKKFLYHKNIEKPVAINIIANEDQNDSQVRIGYCKATF